MTIPTFGPLANTENIIEVCRTAESMGYESLWSGDRTLAPVAQRDIYPGTPDGRMPAAYAYHMDPLIALTFAAANTTKARLGTSALNALWHSPLLLARTLSTLDVLSNGRVDAGFGIGWMHEEYEAVNVPWEGRGARLDELLDALDAIWTQDVVSHKGQFYTIAPSVIEIKPRQRPRPPILLAAFTPASMSRIARRGDGWLPTDMPVPYVLAQWSIITKEAEALGRNPADLKMALRINPQLTDSATAPETMPVRGTLLQYIDYARTAADAGIPEVFIDLGFCARSIAERIDLAGKFIEGVHAG
jgi:probable F420-dependent oxidoreductase